MLSGIADARPPGEKTALVLSSGGLFGAYQAGAWRYLAESSFRPDIVVGASVGALNGWAVAGGCGSLDLSEMWLDEARSNVLKLRARPTLRHGYFEGAPLQALTLQIFTEYRPISDFGLVIVELPFLRSHLVKGGSVTASHLLATASIPVVMPFVSIGGRTFTDGGLLEDVPIWAALELGATRIIAIDAMRFESPWWYRAGVSPMRLLAPRLKRGGRLRVTLVRPSRSLGHYSEAVSWDRGRIRSWIDLGYEDAQRALADEPATVPVALQNQNTSAPSATTS